MGGVPVFLQLFYGQQKGFFGPRALYSAFYSPFLPCYVHLRLSCIFSKIVLAIEVTKLFSTGVAFLFFRYLPKTLDWGNLTKRQICSLLDIFSPAVHWCRMDILLTAPLGLGQPPPVLKHVSLYIVRKG